MYNIKLKSKYEGKTSDELYKLIFSGGDIPKKLKYYRETIDTIKKGGDRETTLSRNIVKTKTLQRIGSQILNKFEGFNTIFDDCQIPSKDEVKEMSENFSENVKEIIDNNPSYNKTEFGGVYDHLPYHRRVIQLSIDDFKQSKYFKSLKVNIDERDEVDMEKKFIEELLQNDCDVNKLKYSDEKEVVNEVEDEVENEEVNEEVSEEVTV